MGEFEKARDSLIQEISGSINSIVINLNTLNRSLNNSIQVGKEFDNVSNLWNNFYTGLKDPNDKLVGQDDSQQEAEQPEQSEQEPEQEPQPEQAEQAEPQVSST